MALSRASHIRVPFYPILSSVLFTSLVRYQFALVIYLLVLEAGLQRRESKASFLKQNTTEKIKPEI